MFGSKTGVLLVGGLGFFLFAFISNVLAPIFMFQNLPERPLTTCRIEFDVRSGGPPPAVPSKQKYFCEPTGKRPLRRCVGTRLYIAGAVGRRRQFTRRSVRATAPLGPVSETWGVSGQLPAPVMPAPRCRLLKSGRREP
jgi:hypothetical protein